MAEKKKATIVIKKIEGGGAGAHGGSWKVAFADFMTAMMCFFLVMWLLNTTEEQKKAVARYFSGPSVIEQYFSAYGAELTLEKLFLDLINEPLKPFQAFVRPADLTPDITSLGMKKLVLAQIAENLGELAKNVDVSEEEITFDIPDSYLFENGSDKTSAPFVSIMEKLRALTTGLEHSDVMVRSNLHQSVLGDTTQTERVAARRMELVKDQVSSSLEHDTVGVKGEIATPKGPLKPEELRGFIRIRIKQREMLPDGTKRRPLEGEIDKRRADMSVYEEFVRRMSKSNKKTR